MVPFAITCCGLSTPRLVSRAEDSSAATLLAMTWLCSLAPSRPRMARAAVRLSREQQSFLVGERSTNRGACSIDSSKSLCPRSFAKKGTLRTVSLNSLCVTRFATNAQTLQAGGGGQAWASCANNHRKFETCDVEC